MFFFFARTLYIAHISFTNIFIVRKWSLLRFEPTSFEVAKQNRALFFQIAFSNIVTLCKRIGKNFIYICSVTNPSCIHIFFCYSSVRYVETGSYTTVGTRIQDTYIYIYRMYHNIKLYMCI